MAEIQIDTSSLTPNSKAFKDAQAAAPGNDISKEAGEKQKLQPVVTNGVVTTKKSLGQKFREAFISDDARSVKSFIFEEVVVPTIKNTIIDVMEMVMFGSSSGRRRGVNRRDDRDRVSYSSYYSYGGSRGSDRDRRRDDRDRYREDEKVNYRSVVLRERRDAMQVVDELRERIHRYGSATIADLFDLIDVSSQYTDNNWGWTDERDIDYRRVANGYLIDVREAEHLD